MIIFDGKDELLEEISDECLARFVSLQKLQEVFSSWMLKYYKKAISINEELNTDISLRIQIHSCREGSIARGLTS